MKSLAGILVLALAACGGGTPPKTCATALCNGVCCADDAYCFSDQSGAQSCATVCSLSSQCGAATPCCQPVIVQGTYVGKSVCTANPNSVNAYTCTCRDSTECGTNECVPLIGDTNGTISGPYVCKPNDGENHNGCGKTSTCAVSGQYCASDPRGNQFCTVPCSGDGDCGNPAACCNLQCHQNLTCCGLCP